MNIVRCPLCGDKLEFIETLEPYNDVTDFFREALENHWCNCCNEGFLVTAYYPINPIRYGKPQ